MDHFKVLAYIFAVGTVQLFDEANTEAVTIC